MRALSRRRTPLLLALAFCAAPAVKAQDPDVPATQSLADTTRAPVPIVSRGRRLGGRAGNKRPRARPGAGARNLDRGRAPIRRGGCDALVDDDYAAVGTANFDNRSFPLNFEVTCLAHDAIFCGEVEAMLEADLTRSTRLTEADFAGRSLPFRLATQGTRLLAPVL